MATPIFESKTRQDTPKHAPKDAAKPDAGDSKSVLETQRVTSLGSGRTLISYHICDYIYGKDDKLVILELGNAENSSFEGRERFNPIKVLERIRKSYSWRGNLELTSAPLRNQAHWRKNERYGVYGEQTSVSDKTKPWILGISDANPQFSREYIQDALAQHLSDPTSNATVLDGTCDILMVCNLNKRVLNTLLKLGGLEHLQPKTWYFNGKSRPEIPKDIPYLVIKDDNGSLAKGLLLIPREDLDLVLESIVNRKSCLSVEKTAHYGEDLKYYFDRFEVPDIHVVIQEYVEPSYQLSNDKSHRATGRAVFEVIKDEKGDIRIQVIDLFWQLAIEPVSDSPEKDGRASRISAKSYQNPSFNCWPTMDCLRIGTKNDKIQDELWFSLGKIVELAYRMDVKGYLKTLFIQKRYDDIRYYIGLYSHTRVDRLDQELIHILITVDKKLAIEFLIDQAKRYALAHHVCAPIQPLIDWLKENLHQLSSVQRNQLLRFMHEEVENLKELNFKKPEFTKMAEEFIKLVLNTQYPGEAPKIDTKPTPILPQYAAAREEPDQGADLGNARSPGEVAGAAAEPVDLAVRNKDGAERDKIDEIGKVGEVDKESADSADTADKHKVKMTASGQ